MREHRRSASGARMGQDHRSDHGADDRLGRLRLGSRRRRLGRRRAGSLVARSRFKPRASNRNRFAPSSASECEPMEAKLGIAPIAWWNDDLAELSRRREPRGMPPPGERRRLHRHGDRPPLPDGHEGARADPRALRNSAYAAAGSRACCSMATSSARRTASARRWISSSPPRRRASSTARPRARSRASARRRSRPSRSSRRTRSRPTAAR